MNARPSIRLTIVFAILLFGLAGRTYGGIFDRIFGASTPKGLVGVWIATPNYQETIEFFEDGEGRWRDGASLQWKILDDGNLKITSARQGEQKIFIANIKDLPIRVLNVEGSEYLPYDKALTGAYADLATAIASQSGVIENISFAKNKYDTVPGLKEYHRGPGGFDVVRGPAANEANSAISKVRVAIDQCFKHASNAITYAPEFGPSYIVLSQCIDLGIRWHQLQSEIDGVAPAESPPEAKLVEMSVANRVTALDKGVTKYWQGQMLNLLAWTRATTKNSALLDPKLALEYAKKAVAIAPDESYFHDTLAAAYARSDDFTNAVDAEEKAITLLASDKGSVREGYQKRLALYKRGQAYTDNE